MKQCFLLSSALLMLFMVEIKADAQVRSIRSIDGRGNNLNNPDWGATGIQLLRKSAVSYPGDGSGESILEEPQRGNPRDISNRITVQEGTIYNARKLSDMVWQWGQFVDHDIDLTNNSSDNGVANIPVNNPDDPLSPLIPFSRSDYDPETGTVESPRQQVNAITAFIDGSGVYGSDEETANSLRTFTGGKLKSSANGSLLPTDAGGFFLAGDVRVNEQVALTVMHTLFMREHNRLADLIATRYGNLTDEEIYQMARKIVGAEIQIITYEEFLPALMGWAAPSPWGGRRYDANVNPSISNEFSTALYRMGHSMLSPYLSLVDETGQETDQLPLKEAFFTPDFLVKNPSRVELVLRGLTRHPAQEIDVKIVEDVRSFLFGPPGGGGLDLASLNIQRGRDHGLPDYNMVRQAYGLSKVNSFEQITSDENLQTALEELYGSIDNIDAWVGSLAEDHGHRGGSVGPLITASLRDQFERLRTGDRFFWMRDPDLRSRQVRSIINLYNLRLSDVIRRNTNIRHIAKDVFHTPGPPRRRDGRNSLAGGPPNSDSNQNGDAPRNNKPARNDRRRGPNQRPAN